eukprot:Transcript_7272.p1 GENE.Transcript_7272~~Transcript_7272.p1  ORF type:complete len:528 (-),score=74.87 Transcript_7272:87-1670(-)
MPRTRAAKARAEAEEAARAEAELEARRPPPEWLAAYCSSAGTQLTPLFQALGVLGAALLACADRAWSQAIEDFRSEETDIDFEEVEAMGRGLGVNNDLVRWPQLRAFSPLSLQRFVRRFPSRVLPRYRRLRKMDLHLLIGAARDARVVLEYSQVFDTLIYRGSAVPDIKTVEDDRAEIFAALADGAWSELRWLSVEPKTDSELARLVDGVLRCPALQELHISSGLADASLQKLLSCEQLRILSVTSPAPWRRALADGCGGSGRRTRSGGPLRATPEPRCQNLEHLILSGCPDVNMTVQVVAKTCPCLRTLSLRDCKNITAKGVSMIGHACPQLEHLHLDGFMHGSKNVGDAAIAKIVQGCPRLQTANLCGTSISDEGLATILRAPLLSRLDVADNWDASLGPVPTDRPVLTWEAVHAARQQHPELQGLHCGDFGHLNIKVVSLPLHEGGAEILEVYFKMRSSTRLQRMMVAFCFRVGVSMDSLRWLFDGGRIHWTDTPVSLGMEDGDVIDVMTEQQYERLLRDGDVM